MIRLLVVAGIVLAAALILGGIDRRAETTALEPQKAAPKDGIWKRLPLECEQYIAMRGAGQQWKRRPACSADLTKRAVR